MLFAEGRLSICKRRKMVTLNEIMGKKSIFSPMLFHRKTWTCNICAAQAIVRVVG